MRRLLQLVAIAVTVAAVMTPLVEAFDCWDPFVMPANDTEMRGFCIVLAICFTLTVVHFFARSLLASCEGLVSLGPVLSPCYTYAISGAFASAPTAAANSSPPPLRI